MPPNVQPCTTRILALLAYKISRSLVSGVEKAYGAVNVVWKIMDTRQI